MAPPPLWYWPVLAVCASLALTPGAWAQGGPEYPLPAYPLPADPGPGALPRLDVRSPRLASDEGTDRRFTISLRTRAAAARSIAAYQLQIRDTRVAQASVSRRRAGARGAGPEGDPISLPRSRQPHLQGAGEGP